MNVFDECPYTLRFDSRFASYIEWASRISSDFQTTTHVAIDVSPHPVADSMYKRRNSNNRTTKIRTTNEKTCTKTETETKMNPGTQCIVPCNILPNRNFRSKKLSYRALLMECNTILRERLMKFDGEIIFHEGRRANC